MEGTEDRDLLKRAEDIKAIRGMLAGANDLSLIHPWAFYIWASLVAAGTLVHYRLYLVAALHVNAALLYIWLPLLLVGCFIEGLSWALKLRERPLPLLNRRISGVILSWIASIAVIAVAVVRLAPVGLSPGLLILFGVLPLAFYAQLCLASLFIEVFGGIALGIALEIAGLGGTALYLAAGLFMSVLYGTGGIHIALAERKRRG